MYSARKNIDWKEVCSCVFVMVLMVVLTILFVDGLDRQLDIEAEQNREWYRRYQKVVPPECDIIKNARRRAMEAE